MKTITFKKRIEVETTIDFPTITFVPEKVNIFSDGYSWDELLYVPKYNNLSRKEYIKETGMDYNTVRKLTEEYVKEINGKGWSYQDSGAYTGEMLSLPVLPKLSDANFRDEHSELVEMFYNLK